MTGKPMTRRRALAILAGSAGALALGGFARAPTFRWQGTALGADATILLAGYDEAEARRIVGLALSEVARLEAIFSLYRADSEIVRLNREGQLAAPSHDMRLLLDEALLYWRRTGGAFNPAIQPLWRYLARHFSGQPAAEPDQSEIARLITVCDPALIVGDRTGIRLQPGMGLTFNGIAQGYITDRVADLLRSEGVADVLLGLGEFRALRGRDWRIGIAGTGMTVPLSDRAVATSAGAGTAFSRDLRWHHLINPASGRSEGRFRSVTVLADRATCADALSTALAASDRLMPGDIRRKFAGVEIVAVRSDGRPVVEPTGLPIRGTA